MNYSAEEILKQLDECSANYEFPMLDNGYVYLAGTKLSAYRDDFRWAMIIEIIGFNYSGGGHNGIENCLYIYGNCLNFYPGLQNETFLHPTNDIKDCNTFDTDEYFYLNPTCSGFMLRDKVTQIMHDRAQYISAGIHLEDDTKIKAFEFIDNEQPKTPFEREWSEVSQRDQAYRSSFLQLDNEAKTQIKRLLRESIEGVVFSILSELDENWTISFDNEEIKGRANEHGELHSDLYKWLDLFEQHENCDH